jgi:hypothetical protein
MSRHSAIILAIGICMAMLAAAVLMLLVVACPICPSLPRIDVRPSAEGSRRTGLQLR